jgi:TPR repeat protein
LDLREYEIASDYFCKAYEKGEPYAAANLATLESLKNNSDSALEWYRKSIDLGLTFGYWLIGDLFLKLNRQDEAIQYFEIGCSKLQPDCLAAMGVIEGNSGNNQEALKYFLKSAETGCSWVFSNLCTYYENLGDTKSAEEWAIVGVERGDKKCQAWLDNRNGDSQQDEAPR